MGRPCDLGRSDNGPVAGGHRDTAVHAHARRAHGGAQFAESSGVDQFFDAFPGGQFTPPMLPFNMFDAAA